MPTALASPFRLRPLLAAEARLATPHAASHVAALHPDVLQPHSSYTGTLHVHTRQMPAHIAPLVHTVRKLWYDRPQLHTCFKCSLRTVWPSGLRRWLQAPVRKGVDSNPTAVTHERQPRGPALVVAPRDPGVRRAKCIARGFGKRKSGHPESNQGPSDSCKALQSDALPTEL